MHQFLLAVFLAVLFFPAIFLYVYGMSRATSLIFKKVYRWSFGDDSIFEVILDFFEYLLSNIAFTVLLVVLTGANITWGGLYVWQRLQVFAVFIGIYVFSKMTKRYKEFSAAARKKNGNIS